MKPDDFSGTRTLKLNSGGMDQEFVSVEAFISEFASDEEWMGSSIYDEEIGLITVEVSISRG